MYNWRYWNCFGLSITSHWICTIRWLFALSSGRFDEFKVFPGVGVFFLGSPFLSSDVDLTVEGFFCLLFGLYWLFGFSGPVLQWRPYAVLLIGRWDVWHLFSRALIGWEFWLLGAWFGGVVLLDSGVQDIFHDEWLWSLVKSWSWQTVVK